MIHLKQIASTDFILLQAEATAAQAILAVENLEPLCIIVCRYQDEQRVHYLFKKQDFLNLLQALPNHTPLTIALTLAEAKVTPCLDAYENADFMMKRCIIIEEDRVIGFYDPSIAPYLGNFRGGDPTQPDDQSLAPWLLETRFPDQVPLGQTFSLQARLARKSDLNQSLVVDVQNGTIVDVMVEPVKGVTLEGPKLGKLVVVDEGVIPHLEFTFRASAMGMGQIRIRCSQSGQTLGSMMISITISDPDQSLGYLNKAAQPLAPPVTALPDLTLFIEEENSGIKFLLTAHNPELNLYFSEFGPTKLEKDLYQWYQEFLAEINKMEPKLASAKLALRSSKLYQDLLPEDLRRKLWTLRERIQSVQIISDNHLIPWELLKMGSEEDGKYVEGPYLSEAFALARWYNTVGRRPVLHLQKIGTIIPNSDLRFYVEESEYMLSLERAHAPLKVIQVIPATWEKVTEELSRGECGGWHFTGHGKYRHLTVDYSEIVLEHETRFSVDELTGRVANFGRCQPLIVFNACKSGQEAISLTGVNSWAHNFIRAGAAGFVGALWDLDDKVALEFTKLFYQHLLGGEPIGEAVKAARLGVRSLGGISWLAYTVYADPMAVVEK
ncbi:MAG TPA: CHAT domain-containing protein [Bacillota bacterium]|nr:CHAT domain-containing protein [Bacillota bacterium]